MFSTPEPRADKELLDSKKRLELKRQVTMEEAMHRAGTVNLNKLEMKMSPARSRKPENVDTSQKDFDVFAELNSPPRRKPQAPNNISIGNFSPKREVEKHVTENYEKNEDFSSSLKPY